MGSPNYFLFRHFRSAITERVRVRVGSMPCIISYFRHFPIAVTERVRAVTITAQAGHALAPCPAWKTPEPMTSRLRSFFEKRGKKMKIFHCLCLF